MKKQILAAFSCCMWACASPAAPSEHVDVAASTQPLTEGCPRGIDINRAAQGFLLGQEELGIYYCQQRDFDTDNHTQCEPDWDVTYYCDAGYNGATDYKIDASSLSCTPTDTGISNESAVIARNHVNHEDDTDPDANWFEFGTVFCECDQQGARCSWK